MPHPVYKAISSNVTRYDLCRGQSRFTGPTYVPVDWKVTSRPARGPCGGTLSVRVSASVARQSTRSCQRESTLSSLVKDV